LRDVDEQLGGGRLVIGAGMDPVAKARGDALYRELFS
jgi:hypothetical protein